LNHIIIIIMTKRQPARYGIRASKNMKEGGRIWRAGEKERKLREAAERQMNLQRLNDQRMDQGPIQITEETTQIIAFAHSIHAHANDNTQNAELLDTVGEENVQVENEEFLNSEAIDTAGVDDDAGVIIEAHK
jgi:hypothetical protein